MIRVWSGCQGIVCFLFALLQALGELRHLQLRYLRFGARQAVDKRAQLLGAAAVAGNAGGNWLEHAPVTGKVTDGSTPAGLECSAVLTNAPLVQQPSNVAAAVKRSASLVRELRVGPRIRVSRWLHWARFRRCEGSFAGLLFGSPGFVGAVGLAHIVLW